VLVGNQAHVTCPVPVEVRFEDGWPVFARFTTALLPERRPTPLSADELARMVGLGPADVEVEGLAASADSARCSCFKSLRSKRNWK